MLGAFVNARADCFECEQMGMSADNNTVKGQGPEPRTPVMILVEASWEDQSGTLQKCNARMENRSTGGACIRLRKLVHVGARLHLYWRWEEFTGTARYCRSDGRDYLVGLQRDPEHKTSTTKLLTNKAGLKATENQSERRARPQPESRQEKPQESGGGESPLTKRHDENVPKSQTVIGAAEMPSQTVREGTQASVPLPNGPLAKPGESFVPRETKQPENHRREAQGVRQERKHMRRKWFELGHHEDTQENRNLNVPVTTIAAPAHPPASAAAQTKVAEKTGDDGGRSDVELLSMPDIYQTAGILNPRKATAS
jgi:hypothetical protein